MVQDEIHPLAITKKLAESLGEILITWSEIGLEGLRTIDDLFAKFVGANKMVRKLTEIHHPEQVSVFFPPPLNWFGGPTFVIKAAQPKIMGQWRQQLRKFRDSLILPD